jgi:hypothetical protein
MATIHAAANGTILRFLHTAALEAEYPNPPAGTDESLTFDERTNAALVTDLRLSADPYRLNAGVLTKNDTPVVIAADSQGKTAVSELTAQFQAAYDRLTDVIDNDATTDTAAEVRAEFRFAARVIRRLLVEAYERLT